MFKARRYIAVSLCMLIFLGTVTTLAGAVSVEEIEETPEQATEERESQQSQEKDETEDEQPADAAEPEAESNTEQEKEEAESADQVQETESAQAPEKDPNSISIVLNGQEVKLNTKPYIQNGVTYAALKDLCEALRCTVTWNNASQVATVTRGTELNLKITAGSDLIEANQRYIYMPGKAVVTNGTMMIPIRGLEKVFNMKISWDSGTKTVTASGGQVLMHASKVYNETDLYWLSRIIYAESGGEPFEGQVAVGNVIMNRVKSNSYPDTIYDVIFDHKHGVQFTPTVNGSIYKTPSEESIIAAKVCLEGYNNVGNSFYFVNLSISPSCWVARNRELVVKIGSTSFFA